MVGSSNPQASFYLNYQLQLHPGLHSTHARSNMGDPRPGTVGDEEKSSSLYKNTTECVISGCNRQPIYPGRKDD